MAVAGKVKVRVSLKFLCVVPNWLFGLCDPAQRPLLAPHSTAYLRRARALAQKFAKIEARRRPRNAREVTVLLDRDEAVWLSRHQERVSGMFGRGNRYIPREVQELARRCAEAATGRIGPKVRTGALLDQTLARSHLLTERHVKRLKARKRAEVKMLATFRSVGSLLNSTEKI